MGAGGVIVLPADYFAQLQVLLKKYDILLVCDEVITGFGRLGDMFGTTTMQLVPDMMVCAKGLSSGYIPISALMINQRVFDAMVKLSDEVGMFGLTMTYSGHPVASESRAKRSEFMRRETSLLAFENGTIFFCRSARVGGSSSCGRGQGTRPPRCDRTR